MERIKEAIIRAKQGHEKLPLKARAPMPGRAPAAPSAQSNRGQQSANTQRLRPALSKNDHTVTLHRGHLAEMRIFAHDGANPHSAHYDMLRTQVLQILETAALRTVAITSPLAGVGKTVTSINLAFSIARQSEQSVLLVDLDFRRPQVTRYLDVQPAHGIDDVLSGTCPLTEATLVPDLGKSRLSVLAQSHPTPQSTEIIVSSAMRTVTAKLAASKEYSIIIYDLPPMLSSDDFLAFLPQVDCAILVAAAGATTMHEITECERLIGSDKFMGCVLNKTSQDQAGYPFYS